MKKHSIGNQQEIMKAITKATMALAALLGLAGCAKENLCSPEKTLSGNTTVTLTAYQENTGTKAEINSENSKLINWIKDDAITVIDGEGNNVKFTLTDGAGTTTGTFESEEASLATSYTALYPYQKDVTLHTAFNITTLKGVVLKSEQTAVPGSFDPEAALMTGTTGDGSTNLSFKNIVGFVKLTPAVSCKKITLTGTSSAALAGTADITMNNEGLPVASVKDKASSSVSISGDIEAGETYYIAIFPAEMESFSLTFTASDGQNTCKSSSKPLTIKRNYVTSLGEVEGGEYPYITFTAESSQKFKISQYLNLECSVGGSDWQDVKANTEVEFGGSNGDLRLRGGNDKNKNTSGTYLSGLTTTISFTEKDVPVSCKGDIRTLIDWENYATVETKDARFSYLFQNCSVLTSAPDLPSKNLSKGCYFKMFKGCTSLEIAPALPATVLANTCYESMFYGCTGLTTAPALPATALAESCYKSMFRGCTILDNASDLPAEKVPDNAYNEMFYECTSLKAMPTISAKTVNAYGMQKMFYGCSNLSTVTDLCIETFKTNNNGAGYNCDGMFSYCKKLTAAPKLPATTLADYCYQDMFNGCEKLSSAPELNASSVHEGSYQRMFANCTALKKAPALPATEVRKSGYQQMFSGCKNMETGPESLPATELKENCYYRMFNGCISLTKVPKLMAKKMDKGCCAGMFMSCKKIDKVTLYVQDFDTNYSPFTDWLSGTAKNSNGTLHIRSGLLNDTKTALCLPNNWTFAEDVTD